MERKNGLVRFGIVLFLAATGATWPAVAQSVDASFGWFESSRYNVGAAVAGGRTYYLGGATVAGYLDTVAAYDPSRGGAATASTCRLPEPMFRGMAASDGTRLYYFGGLTPAGRSNAVHRLTLDPTDPLRCTAARVGTLPVYFLDGVVVWSGSVFYLLGGYDGDGTFHREILRFDPESGATTTTGVRLPSDVRLAGGAWMDGRAFVVGGASFSAASREVLAYDPVAATVEVVALLQAGRFWTATAAAAGQLLVFGGATDMPAPTSEIFRIDPVLGRVVRMTASLPSPRAAAAATWDGTSAHVAGGYGFDAGYYFLNQIVRYEVVPSTPTEVRARSGDAPGEIVVSWTPPPEGSYLRLEGYRVLRSTIKDATPAQSIAFDVPVGSSFVDYDLVPGIRYFYRVAAVSPQGASPFSGPVDARAAVLPQTPAVLGVRPVADGDGDGVTDSTESTVCSGAIVPALLNGMSPAYAGTCEETNYWAGAWWDENDDDGIPDRVEPALCAALVADDLRRGVCHGQDYGIAPARWSELVGYPGLPVA